MYFSSFPAPLLASSRCSFPDRVLLPSLPHHCTAAGHRCRTEESAEASAHLPTAGAPPWRRPHGGQPTPRASPLHPRKSKQKAPEPAPACAPLTPAPGPRPAPRPGRPRAPWRCGCDPCGGCWWPSSPWWCGAGAACVALELEVEPRTRGRIWGHTPSSSACSPDFNRFMWQRCQMLNWTRAFCYSG